MEEIEAKKTDVKKTPTPAKGSSENRIRVSAERLTYLNEVAERYGITLVEATEKVLRAGRTYLRAQENYHKGKAKKSKKARS